MEVESLSVQYWLNSTMPSSSPSEVTDGDYARNLRLLTKFQEDLRVVTDRYEHRKSRIAAKVLYLEQKMGIKHQDSSPEPFGPCNSTGPAPSLKSTGPGECDKHIVTAAGLSFIVALLLVGLFTAIIRLCSGARKSEAPVRHSEGGGGRSGRDHPRHDATARFVDTHYRIEVIICSYNGQVGQLLKDLSFSLDSQPLRMSLLSRMTTTFHRLLLRLLSSRSS